MYTISMKKADLTIITKSIQCTYSTNILECFQTHSSTVYLPLQLSHFLPPLSQQEALLCKERCRAPPRFPYHPPDQSPLGLRQLRALSHLQVW